MNDYNTLMQIFFLNLGVPLLMIAITAVILMLMYKKEREREARNDDQKN